MITIKDMAKELGLSTTTVSNVIHGKTGEVSQKTVERVRELLEKYDYIPNINARSLAQNSSNIIGVALKSRDGKYVNIIADPFFGELLGVLEAEIRARGYFMMIYTSDDIHEILRSVLTWNVRGLLMLGMLHDDFVHVKKRFKKPTVLIDSYTPGDLVNYVNIGLEDEEGAYRMASYLLAKGHRRIAFVADNMEGVEYYRYRGYRKACEEHGVSVQDSDLLIIRPGMLERESSMNELYYRSKEYTAFMCCSDYYAVILMNYFADRGVHIPEDISFTGFDDNIMATVVRPALTTIRQDVPKKGRLAVDYLIRQIEGQEVPEYDVKLPVELVVRGSVREIGSGAVDIETGEKEI